MYPAPACRFRRVVPATTRRFVSAAGLFLALVLFLLNVPPLPAIYPSLVETMKNTPARMIAIYQREPLKILKTAMPVLGWSSFEGDAGGRNSPRILWDVIEAVGRVSLHSPVAVLQSQIPLLAAVEPPGEAVVNRPGDSIPDSIFPARTVSSLPGECLVSIYNTHTGETYSLTDGVERLDGKHGGVVTAAAALQEALENKYGIKVARSDKINDLSYNTSYIESEKTARELLAANPKTRVILDIHRDSGKTREQSVVIVNGREAAPILFIVGSDARRPFPAWRQNHAFAVEFSTKINEMYPGLSLGVRVKDGLYNQFLHPRAVLVEVGTTKNSTEEAVRSARLLADVLAGMLAGKEKSGPSVSEE